MVELASVRLFAGMRRDQTDTILSVSVRRAFRRSEIITTADSPASHLFLLEAGNVNFYVTTESGRMVLLRRLMPGDAFGIACILDQPMGYLATGTAVNNVEVLTWDHSNVRRLVSAYPRLCENALRIALRYIREYATRHVSLVSENARGRLAYTLMGLGSRAGHAKASGLEIDIKNEDLASLADVSPYTTSRLLQKWERAGVVEKRRGRVLILCPEALLEHQAPSTLAASKAG